MIKYNDHRFIPIAYHTSDGRLMLPDELLQATPEDYPAFDATLKDWDAELALYKLTGVSGTALPAPGPLREALRELIRAAIEASKVKPSLVRINSVWSNREQVLIREALLREANEAYVNQVPMLPDASYDSEWRMHELDRKGNPGWFDTSHPSCLFPDGSILDKVGAAPSPTSGFEKVRHGTPMRSINDVFEGDGVAQYEELLAFVRDMEKKLGNLAWPMQVEPKVDGLAVKLVYRNGLLTIGMTRGDGEVGDDVTANLLTAGVVPSVLDAGNVTNQGHALLNDPLTVVGEVYMPVVAFHAANAKREAEGLQLWANPRNAAAGALKLQDADELKKRPLAFVRHDGYSPWIDGMAGVVSLEVHNWEMLIAAIEQTRHGEYPFATDGAVVKLVAGGAREIVGMGTRAPNWACAFKFKPVQVETTLEGIIVQVGRSGVLTPKALLAPVAIDGTTVTHATLNNEGWIQEMGLQVGDTVMLQKAGAIIPEITESVTRRERHDRYLAHYRIECPDEEAAQSATAFTLESERPPFSLVDFLGGKCPSCGSTDLQKQVVETGEGAKWKCMNASGCPAQLSSRIEHFCSRGCLDIEGIGGEAAIALASLERVTSPLDLFQMPAVALAALNWTTTSGGRMTFGTSRADKAVAALVRAKSLPLRRWLRALGIPSVGENTSKEISRLCMDAAAVAGMVYPISGIAMRIEAGEDKSSADLAKFAISSHLGPVSAAALTAYFRTTEGQRALDLLKEWGVESDNYDPIPTASDAKPLFGKTFAITGTLSVGRDEMKALIESKGGKVSGSVSKKTNYLVAGEGGGQKADKAREAGVVILTEAELRGMM